MTTEALYAFDRIPSALRLTRLSIVLETTRKAKRASASNSALPTERQNRRKCCSFKPALTIEQDAMPYRESPLPDRLANARRYRRLFADGATSENPSGPARDSRNSRREKKAGKSCH